MLCNQEVLYNVCCTYTVLYVTSCITDFPGQRSAVKCVLEAVIQLDAFSCSADVLTALRSSEFPEKL